MTIALFSLLNYMFRDTLGLNRENEDVTIFIDAFYFTMITLTTLGYGDVVPASQIGRLVVAFESSVGLILFALFASMMFRKIAP